MLDTQWLERTAEGLENHFEFIRRLIGESRSTAPQFMCVAASSSAWS